MTGKDGEREYAQLLSRLQDLEQKSKQGAQSEPQMVSMWGGAGKVRMVIRDTHQHSVLLARHGCGCVLGQVDGEDGCCPLVHATQVGHLWGV